MHKFQGTLKLPSDPKAVTALLSPGPAISVSLCLVGSGSWCDGRVEILQCWTWGRVLDEQWDVQGPAWCGSSCGAARQRQLTPPETSVGLGTVGL